MAEALTFMALEGHGVAWLPLSLVRHGLAGGSACTGTTPLALAA